MRLLILLVAALLSGCGTTIRQPPAIGINKDTLRAASHTFPVTNYCTWRDVGGPFESGRRVQRCEAQIVFSDDSQQLKVFSSRHPSAFEMRSDGQWKEIDTIVRTRWDEDVLYEPILLNRSRSYLMRISTDGPPEPYTEKLIPDSEQNAEAWTGPIVASPSDQLEIWIQQEVGPKPTLNLAPKKPETLRLGVFKDGKLVRTARVGVSIEFDKLDGYLSSDRQVLVLEKDQASVYRWHLNEAAPEVVSCSSVDIRLPPSKRNIRWDCAMAVTTTSCADCGARDWGIEKIRTSKSGVWAILETSTLGQGFNRRVRLFDTVEGVTVATYLLESEHPPEGRWTDIGISPDGKSWAYANTEGKVFIFAVPH